MEQVISLKVNVDNKQGMQAADQLGKAFTAAVNPKGSYGSAAKASAEKAYGQGETKTARSVGNNAGTGSAASDFAAQARGLGGLVHVYATFAANIFAVSAAFNALSKAMDVTNLVKGLDQIGASSGKNLGSLAKQMVSVADGAISMQQAMSSTAMASAGGMTNQAILRMTEVAKKASLALGRDMTDSMDRITKGIIKTQPELLDELGIMTRVIPAQQEYARSIGKTAASLTDFEKRQAFANAVLAEGERKFGAIAMDANPFSKVLASVTNLMQGGLELINKFLAPVMGLLASSPTGLAVALGGIAAVLMKQAIPAIGMFRENAKKMEQETHDRVTRQVKEQQAAAIASDAIIASKASRDYQASEASAKAIAELPKRFSKKIVGSEIRGLLAKSPYDLSEADMALIKSKQEQLAASTDERYKKEAENIKKRYEGNLVIQKAALDAGYNATIVQIDKDEKAWTHASMKKRELDKLTRKAAVSSILSNTADTAAIQGPSIAFKQLREQTSALDAGKITKYATVVKGSFSIITSAIGTAMNAFGVWAQVIGLALAGLGMFDSWVSKSAKESEAFSSSIETLNSSFANVDRTLEVINKKGSLDFLSVESIQAKATALNDLTGNLADVVSKFGKLQDAQNGWDKFFDGFWDMFGKGSGDKLALGVSNSVISALKLMREGPAKEEAKKAIQGLFNTKVDLSSVKSFNESIKDLDKTEIQQKAKSIEALLSTASREANNAASAMTGFKTALADIGRQSTSMSNAILPKDEFSKMGMELAKGSNQMAEALKDPINGLTILRELAGDIKTLSFLPPGIAAQLGAAKAKMDELAVSIANLEKEAQRNPVSTKGTTGPLEVKALNDIEDARIAKVQSRIKKETDAAEALKSTYAAIPDLLNKASMELLTKGLANALNEASVVAAKGYISVLNAAGIGTANETAAADQQAISGQMELVKANYANVIAQESLKVSIDALTLISERAILEEEAKNHTGESSVVKYAELIALNTKKFAEVVARGNILSNSRDTNLKLLGNKNAEGVPLEQKQALEQMTTYMYALIGSEQQLAKLRAQSGVIELTRRVAVIAEEIKHEKELLDVKAKNLNTDKEGIALAIRASVDYSPRLQAEKEANDKAVEALSLDKELLAVKQKIRSIQLAIETGGSTAKTRAAMEEAGRERNAIEAAAASKNKDTEAANLRARLVGEESLRIAYLNRNTEQLKQSEAVASASAQLYEVELNYQKSIGTLKESEYITIKAGLDIAKQRRDYEISAAEAATNGSANIIKIFNELKEAESVPNSDTSGIKARLAEAQQAYTSQFTVLDAINNAKIKGISLTAEQAALLANQADQMERMESITNSLATAFGEIGSSIGAAGKAMLKFAHNEEKFLVKRLAIEEQLKDAKTDTQISAARAKLNKLDEKHTQDQLDGISEVAGATKKMFDEKSTAHKAFAAIEKVTAAASMSLKVQAMAQDLATLPAKISGGIASLFSQGGFAGFAGAAAFLAMLGQGGGGGGAVTPTIPPGLTAEEMQKTQGTGTTFGDDNAKSASIQNSLDLIAETSVEGMSYYNEMVGLLTAIKDSIGNLAISLYDTKGIRTGTNFGTVEATSGGGGGLLSGLFGSSSTDTSIINSGIQLQGTFMDLARAATTSAASLNQFETVQTTTTKSGALFGLFGGGSSTSITNNIKELDSTVREQIGGIFTNASQLFVAQGKKLGASQESVIAMLEGVDVNKLASLRGLKGKELEEELNAVIGGIMDDAAKKLFPKLDQFKKFNEGYAQTVTRVLDTSDKVNQAFLQLGRPLKVLEEVASKSTEQMVLNIAAAKAKLDRANQAVSSFKPTTSEAPIGYGTVTSEIDPSLIREQAEAERELAEARRIEAEAASGMTVKNLELTESFANAAGGLDKFLDLTTSFTEKYLTLSEQLAPKMNAMHTEMARLGIPLNTTKEQLKQLILGFDTSNASQAQYYVDLLKLADAYDTNRSALNDLADSYGIGEDAIKGILQGAVEAASGSGEVGYSITGAILDSIKTAMYEQASSAISTVIFDTVVTPMVKSMLAGTLAADLMSGAFDSAIASAATMIDNISNVFNNPELMGILDGLSEKITGLFEKGAAALGGIKVPGTSGPSQGGTYGSGSSSQTTLLESNGLELKKVQAQLLIAENKSIEGNILLKEVQAAIEAEELKKIDAVNKVMYLANKQREKEMNILKERINLQNELNSLTDNAIEALARQREALDESNRAIFDQIQALKGAKALLQAQVSSTELFTPVETLTLKIKELAEQAKAAGAGSSLDDLIASFSSMNSDEIKELANSILAMTDISDAMKASFLEILNSLHSVTNAEKERIKGLEDALESTRQSIAQAYQSYVDAEKTARENITSGYLSAQERVKSAQEAINEALKQNAEELRDFANNIREFLLELATTDLGGRSKASQYKSLQEDYTKTYALALTGDATAIGSITNKASELLKVGKEQSSTSLEYAILAGEIGANLEALATITDGKAGPLAEAVDPMVKLQKELVDATEDMERWTHAASVSGASTTAIVKDYLAEWRVAKAELTLAQQLIEENGINISLLSSIESFKKLIAEYAAAAARLTASNSGAVTAVIPTEIPGVKDSLTAAEVKAQMTNFGNWYDWSTPEGNKGGITAVHQFAERWKMSSATLEGIMGWAAGYANQQYASVGLTALATGTNYVPQDMIAQIHEGEAVVPKAFNPYAGGSTSTNNQQDLIREIRLLKQEVSDLKQSNNMSVAYNKKTSDILTRVTLGGEAMQTQAA